ncbi:MAG TPA: penicillin-binding protein 2 [bacterium]|nr:penicillin-binding protein 2 [bacterium]
MNPSFSKRRFFLTHFFVLSLFLVVGYQVVQLCIIRRPALYEIAQRQHRLVIETPPLRGMILDRDGKELATSLKVPSIYAVPRLISKEEVKPLSKKISEMLKLNEAYVEDRLSRDKAFIWLKRKADLEEAEKIRQLEHPAFGIMEEYKRFYPQKDLLSQVLGFVDIDNRGLEGIELHYNRELQGRAGRRYTKRDALGHEIKAFETKAIPAVDGHHVVLTVDQYLQYLMERALDRAFHKSKAIGASAVLMEAKTGKILAMSNRPTYDPNQIKNSVPDARRNRVVTDMYEPGSIFKIVTASAALNENKVNMNSTFFCENGRYRYYRSRVLHDVHAYGRLMFPEVIIKSSNIGTVKIAALLKPDLLQSYIQGFGFGRSSGIDLPGEAPGYTRPPSEWSATSPYNIPIGQEVQVTLLQMATSMAVIANGGDLLKPYIIDHTEDQAGVRIRENQPTFRKKVIRPEVAQQMREILVRVVEEGTGKNAKINDMAVGGKTGTAQKILPNGRGYSHSNFMASFFGFGPAEDPLLVMAVVLDDPKPVYYGGVVAAPVFKEVMESALLALGYVPPNAQKFEPLDKMQTFPKNPPMPLPAHVEGKGL